MDTLSIVIIGVACLAIGFLGGTIINTLRGEKKPVEIPEPAALEPAAPGPIAPEYLKVAEFMRAKENGPLLVKLDDKVVGSEVELNPEQRTNLEDLLLELRTWLGYKPFTTDQASVEPLPDQLGEALFSKDNNVFTDEMPAPAVTPVSAPPFTGSKSIVGQIDDILQEKLITTVYASRRIRLIEKPNQGVVVQIGLQQYQGIEEVPDPEIKNLIHQSVAEWETRAR